jgi:hypothetical protein
MAGLLAGLFISDRVFRPLLGPVSGQAGDGDWGSYFLTLAVASTTVGTTIGLMQWLVLRRQVPRAGWWVLASALGFLASIVVFEALHVPLSDVVLTILGGVAIGLVQWLVLRRQFSGAIWWVPATTLGFTIAQLSNALPYLVGTLAWAGVLGAITGGVLIWLLRRSPQQAPGVT